MKRENALVGTRIVVKEGTERRTYNTLIQGKSGTIMFDDGNSDKSCPILVEFDEKISRGHDGLTSRFKLSSSNGWWLKPKYIKKVK